MIDILLPLVTNVAQAQDYLPRLAENFIVHFSILIVGLFLVRLIRISLTKFLGLYVILGGLSVGMLFLGEQSEFWLQRTIILGVSLLLIVILSGVSGNAISQHNYQAILVGIGLFPWYLGWGTVLVYGFLAFIIIVFTAHFRIGAAFKKIDVKRFNIKEAKDRLTEEQYEIFRKYGSITFSMPLLISAILTVLVAS